jgi:DNA-3-methyladenine glycosylase II
MACTLLPAIEGVAIQLDRSYKLKHLSFSITPVPPFRLDLTAWAIRRRPVNEMDVWDGESYRRVLAIQDTPVLTSVTQSGGADAPRLKVTLCAANIPRFAKTVVTVALERLLGLRIDLRSFYCVAAKGRLHDLASRFRGLKPPRFPTVWEGLVNGIACQQFSLTSGLIMLNRLTKLCGLPLERNAMRVFPRPADLATVAPESLRSLGFSSAKTDELIGLGKRTTSGELDLESIADLENQEAVGRLLELPGVGRWTAEYVLLRGMGRTDVFPGDDVGARNNLARWLHLRKPLDYSRVRRITAKWQPYGGLIYFHLLLDGLERAGHLRLQPGNMNVRAGPGGATQRAAQVLEV